MKRNLLCLFMLLILTIGFTGCGKDSKESVSDNNSSKSEETVDNDNNSDDEYYYEDTKDDEVSYLDVNIHRVQDYVDNTIEINTRGQYLSSIPYLLNNKFEATFTWDFPANRIGAYIITTMPDDDNKYYVYDANGNIVFEYNEKDYQDVELLNHGYLYIKKKTDTYNSTETTIGIYSLKDSKYVVEPSSEYTILYLYGDDMYNLDEDRKVFFNAKTGKIVRFNEYVSEEFQDGYAVTFDLDSIKIFKDDGTIKTIDYNYENTSYRAGAIKNGYAVDVYNGIEVGVFRFINLETGAVLDFSDKFHRVINNPTFTKDGYALVVFNNPGGITYYTVINTSGEMQFEPEKVSDSNPFLSGYDKELPIISVDDIVLDKYIVLSDNDNALSQVKNLKNETILTGETGETFVGMVNGTVIVKISTNLGDEYYFKDLKGNKIKYKNKINN